MMKGILSFSQIESLLFRPREKNLFYWIPSHVGIIGNEKADTAAKAGLSKRVTNVPIHYGDFRKHQYPFKTQMAVSVG